MKGLLFNIGALAAVQTGAKVGVAAGALFEDYHLYTSRTGTSTVNVQIFDEKNSPLDRCFYLAVFC